MTIQSLRTLAIKIFLIAIIITALSAIAALAYEVDTTRVREKPENSESAGERLLKVSSLLITTPVIVLKAVSKFTVDEIVMTKNMRLFAGMFASVDRVWGFYPVLGYGSNSGFKGGFAFTSKEVFTKGHRIKIKGSYSTHKYQRYQLKYSVPNKFHPVKDAYFFARYRRRPYESYYGSGILSKESNEVAFTLEEGLIDIGSAFIVLPSTKLYFRGTYRILNIYDGEDPNLEGRLFEIKNKFGFGNSDLQDVRILSAGIGITHDWRNHPGQPTKGGYESAGFTYTKGFKRSRDLEYMTGRVDIRHFLNIYKKRLLAVRIFAESIDPIGDSPYPPFYLLNSLGGEKDLRGYRTRRFVDNDVALASIEYRWPILGMVDFFLFLDEGRVFKAIREDFTFKGWRWSSGGGIRIWNAEGITLNTLLAFSDEGARYYLQFSEEF